MLTIIRLTIEANKIAEVDTIADANTTVKVHVALALIKGWIRTSDNPFVNRFEAKILTVLWRFV